MKEQIGEIFKKYSKSVDTEHNVYNCLIEEDWTNIAKEIEKSQTKYLLIAMLESQLKVEIKKQEAYLFTIKEGNTQAGHVMNALLLVCVRTSAELERQINELKG